MLQTWKVLSLHLNSHSAAFFHTHWYPYAVTCMASLSHGWFNLSITSSMTPLPMHSQPFSAFFQPRSVFYTSGGSPGNTDHVNYIRWMQRGWGPHQTTHNVQQVRT